MLKILRSKNVTKAVLWGILILIMPAFVLWGTGNLGGNKDKGPTFVGLLDGKKVTFDDYYRSIAAMRAQIIMNYFAQPTVMDVFLKNKRFLGKLAWDRLIMEREADKLRIKISDADVVSYIRSAPIFLRDGAFDNRAYAYLLKNSIGMDPRTFEETVRGTLSIQRMNDVMTRDVNASDADALSRYKQDNARFKASYALFAVSDFTPRVNIADDEIAGYYESHKNEFTLPADDAQPAEEAGKPAALEDVKENIKSMLSGDRAVRLAAEEASKKREEVAATMAAEGASFEAACAKASLKTKMTGPFAKKDYLDGIGDAIKMAETAGPLKAGELSALVEVRSGYLFFALAEEAAVDTADFEKNKEEYRKKALEDRKNKVLEDWLRNLESQTMLNIDFADYEKYYK